MKKPVGIGKTEISEWDERERYEIVYGKVKAFPLKPPILVFLYNISESISSQCDRSVRGGFAGLFLESLRFRATAYLIFWQHERFSTALDLVKATEEATTCGGSKYFQENSKKSKTRSHYRRLDKALIMCIIRV